MQIGLLILVCLLASAGVIAAIAWPLERRRDPFAGPFGDVPPMPQGSIERGNFR